MSDGGTPPPRPIRPLNYVVTEFLDDSGPPKMPPRPNNGVMQSEAPQRGPPPPIPSYRQHVETRDDHFYQEVSPPRDSDSSDRALTNKQSSMTPPPTAHYDTPLIHTRRNTLSGRISNSTEPSSTTAREERVVETKAPHAPLRPLRSTPATTANTSTKATPPRPSGTVRPKNQAFQRDPPPPPRPVQASSLSRGSPSTHQEERQGNVFSNLFKKKSVKKPKPVITVVDSRPIDSETTPSPVKSLPTSLPPARSHDSQKSLPSETTKRPDRPTQRLPAPSVPPPSTPEAATGAKDPPAGTQAKDGTPVAKPRSRTSSHSSKPCVTGKSGTSEMAGEREPVPPHRGAAAEDQGQASPVPKPRTKTMVKKPPVSSDTPLVGQNEAVVGAGKGEEEKSATQQPAKTRPPPPTRPRASTLDVKRTVGGKVKMEGTVNMADASTHPSGAVGTAEGGIQSENAPTHTAQTQEQPANSKTPTTAPVKPSLPSTPRPPPPVRQASQGTAVEASITSGSGGATMSVGGPEEPPDVDALYSVPQKPARKADPIMVLEELKNTPPDVAAVEKTPGQQDTKVENTSKVLSPKRKAPPKPAPPNRVPAATPTSSLVKTKPEVSTAKEDGDTSTEKKAAVPQADALETATPASQDPPDVDALYAVPQKPARKANPIMVVEELANTPPDVAAMEKTPGQQDLRGEGSPRVSSPKRKAPPKPAPPKAPTLTSPLVKAIDDTKQEVHTVKEGDGKASLEKKAAVPQADALETATPANEVRAATEVKENQASEGSGDQSIKSAKAPAKDSLKKPPPKPKPPPPTRPHLPTPEKKEAGSVKSGDASTAEKTSQLDVVDQQADKREARDEGGAALKVDETSTSEEPSGEIVKATPSDPTPFTQDPPDVDALYAVPQKPARKANPIMVGEELTNIPPDVAAVEKTRGQHDAKVENSSEVPFPKRKAPPKPAPPNRVPAATPTSSLVKTKPEVSTAKEDSDTSTEKKAAGPQADALETATPANEVRAATKDKENQASEGSGDQSIKSAKAPARESLKKPPPKPKPPPPTKPHLPTPEKKEAGSVRSGDASTAEKTSQLDDVEQQAGKREARHEGGAALKVDETSTSAEPSGEIVKATPSDPTPFTQEPPDVDALYAVPQKPARKANPIMVGEELANTPPDVAAVEKTPGQQDLRGEGSPKVSSPKRKAPPKPAPPKAPTPTSPLVRTVGDTKQEVPTVKEGDGKTSLEKKAAGPQADALETATPANEVRATTEVKEIQASEGSGDQSIKSANGPAKESLKKPPPKPKPPPPTRPHLPTPEKKEAGSVKSGDASSSKQAGQLDVAEGQACITEGEDKSGGAAVKVEEASKSDKTAPTARADGASSEVKALEHEAGEEKDMKKSASAGGEDTVSQPDKHTDANTASPKKVPPKPPPPSRPQFPAMGKKQDVVKAKDNSISDKDSAVIQDRERRSEDTTAVQTEKGPEMEGVPTVSSPQSKAATKPAPPTKATPTSPLMKAFTEAMQDAFVVKKEEDAGSEKKAAEQTSEVNEPATGTGRGEVEVTVSSVEEALQAKMAGMSLGGGDAEGGTITPEEVTPAAQAKKKLPPKPGLPSKPKRPGPARPPMKVAKATEPATRVPTTDSSSVGTSSHSPQETLLTSDTVNLPLATESESSRMSPPEPAAAPLSKKTPPPKPGPPSKPKPPAPAKVEAPLADRQQQEPTVEVGSPSTPLEDTIPTLLSSSSGVDGEVATESEAVERANPEVEVSSPSTPLSTEAERTGQRSESIGEHPQSPGPSDVITTPTNPSSGNSGGGKPTKPPPPGGSRPPPPSGDKRKPPPPKRPPPAKGPPPPKPKQPGPSRHQANAPPPLPPRPVLGHILYCYVTTEPRAVAKYNFTAQLPGELSFDEGDTLEIIAREDVSWLVCRNVTDHFSLPEGLVHERHIKIIKKLPEEAQSVGESGPCAVAMSEFRAESFQELSLKSGDLVYLDSRVDLHWLRGHLENGASGIFPKDVVEIVEDLPEGPMECEAQQLPAFSGPHCVVEFSFNAEDSSELSLNKGDVVELVERVGGDWLKGRLAGREGIFPANFVNIIEDLPPAPTLGPNVAAAVADFDGMEGELSFKVGEHVTVTGRVDEDWLEGSLHGRKGIFPASFIDRVPPGLFKVGEKTKESSPVQQSGVNSKPAKTGKCKALHKFETNMDGELPLNQGDVIVTTAWINDEWLSGRLGDKEGIFPVSFVEILEELPQSNVEVSKHHHKVTPGEDLMPKGTVLYDFTPATDEEIPLKAGETVLLLEKIDQAWYNGENSAGAIGNFPADYVQVVVPLP